MKFEVKTLGPGDNALMHSALDCFGTVFDERATYGDRRPSAEYLESLLSGDSLICLVAVSDSRVIGALAAYELKKFEQPRSEIYIDDLGVYEEFRRRGVATALIEHLQPIAVACRAAHPDATRAPASAGHARLGPDDRRRRRGGPRWRHPAHQARRRRSDVDGLGRCRDPGEPRTPLVRATGGPTTGAGDDVARRGRRGGRSDRDGVDGDPLPLVVLRGPAPRRNAFPSLPRERNDAAAFDIDVRERRDRRGRHRSNRWRGSRCFDIAATQRPVRVSLRFIRRG